MPRLKLSLLVGVCLLFAASNAKADTFDLTAKGAGLNISFVLTGTAVSGSPGFFDITSLTGTVNGVNAVLLSTTSPGAITETPFVNGWAILYNDVLNLNGPYLDVYGLGFELLPSGTLATLFDSGGYIYAQLGNNPPTQESVSITVVAAPEPKSAVLMLSGLLAIALMLYRRRQTA